MANISDIVINDIKNRLVEPSYKTEIERLLFEKKNWKKSGQVFEVSSKVFLAVGSIVSFAAGFYQDIPIISFVSGTISVVSLSLLQFSSFCYLEHKRQSNELNIWLKKLGLEPLPVVSRDINNDSDMYKVASNSPDKRNSMELYKYNDRIRKENTMLKNELDLIKKSILNENYSNDSNDFFKEPLINNIDDLIKINIQDNNLLNKSNENSD